MRSGQRHAADYRTRRDSSTPPVGVRLPPALRGWRPGGAPQGPRPPGLGGCTELAGDGFPRLPEGQLARYAGVPCPPCGACRQHALWARPRALPCLAWPIGPPGPAGVVCPATQVCPPKDRAGHLVPGENWPLRNRRFQGEHRMLQCRQTNLTELPGCALRRRCASSDPSGRDGTRHRSAERRGYIRSVAAFPPRSTAGSHCTSDVNSTDTHSTTCVLLGEVVS